MRKRYSPPEVEFVMFESNNIIHSSEVCSNNECPIDDILVCSENCSCYFCVGVCTWDCTSDDSTCTTGDYNP